jgi:hypothetical protein
MLNYKRIKNTIYTNQPFHCRTQLNKLKRKKLVKHVKLIN